MNTSHNSLSQQVWSATFWNTLSLPANFAVGIIASVLYYQILPLEQVGLIFLLTSLASTIGLYADLGIERALARYLPEVEHQGGRDAVRLFLRQMIKLKLAILLVLVVGLNLLAGPLIAHLANQQRGEIASIQQRITQLRTEAEQRAEVQRLEQQIAADQSLIRQIEARGRWFILAVTALLMLGALFDIYMQFLTAYFKQRAWNLITLAARLLQPTLVTLFLLLGWGISGVLLGLVITPLVSLGLATWQTQRAMRMMTTPVVATPIAPSLYRRFTNYAAVSYLMQISVWFYDLSFVVFVLAATLGFRETAVLSFAYKFAKDFLGYVWTPLGGVITPLLTRIKVGRDHTALRDAHASLTRLLLLLLVPSGIGLVVIAPYAVAVLYPKYVEATTLIIIFVGFTFVEALLSVPHNVLMVYEQYRIVVLSRLFAVLSVPAVLVLLPWYGLVGVAIAVGAVRVLSRLVSVVYALRKLDLTLPAGFAVRVTAASAGFAIVLLGVLRWWPAEGAIASTPTARVIAFVPLLGVILLGAVLFVVFLRIMGGLDETERRRLLGLRLPFQRVLSRLL